MDPDNQHSQKNILKDTYFTLRETKSQQEAADEVGRDVRTIQRWEKEARDSAGPPDPWASMARLKPEVAREAMRYLLGIGFREFFQELSLEVKRQELGRSMFPPWLRDENGDLFGGAWEIVERRKRQPHYKGYNEEAIIGHRKAAIKEQKRLQSVPEAKPLVSR